jgi:hypothetical protein
VIVIVEGQQAAHQVAAGRTRPGGPHVAQLAKSLPGHAR